MMRSAPAVQALVPDACLAAAASLFTAMHAAPTLDNAERLAQWLGTDPRHVRALDIALTEWGLARSGHPVGDVRDVRGGHDAREVRGRRDARAGSGEG
jgi:hypothetical protein